MPAAPIPRTVGHHFSDLLICRQKAWLHYHGDNHKKMKPPAHLRARQQEGHQIEELVYQSRYPNGVRIPGFGRLAEERLTLTLDAMRQGTPVILQGYIQSDLGEGTLDVMECLGPDQTSSLGYAYRVGEIKRSETLKTAHILQVSWYTELLEQVCGQQVREGLFILGRESGQILVESLEDHRQNYIAQKADLFNLRDSGADPGPHLIPACLTCDWRGVCMERMIAEKHLSLAPALSRSQAEILRSQGYSTWYALAHAPDACLFAAGMGELEIDIMRNGVEALFRGYPPLRQLLRGDIFDDALVVSLEFSDLREQRREDDPLQPIAVHFEDGGGVQMIPVSYAPDGFARADLTPLTNGKKLVLFGGTDIGPIVSLYRQQFGTRPQITNLIDFIEDYVHSPLTGLELDTLVRYILGQVEHPRGQARVPAIRRVLDWIRSSL
jgi:CRISPR/Cas system-associated exonuclease Cas4 (RecB family)